MGSNLIRKWVTFKQRPECNVRGRHGSLWKKGISADGTACVKTVSREGAWWGWQHLVGEDKVLEQEIREQAGDRL